MLTTDAYRMDTVHSTLSARSVCLLFFHWLSWASCPVPFDFHGKWAFLKALKNHGFTCILMNKYVLCITNNMHLFFLFTRQYENMLLNILFTWGQIYSCEYLAEKQRNLKLVLLNDYKYWGGAIYFWVGAMYTCANTFKLLCRETANLMVVSLNAYRYWAGVANWRAALRASCRGNFELHWPRTPALEWRPAHRTGSGACLNIKTQITWTLIICFVYI